MTWSPTIEELEAIMVEGPGSWTDDPVLHGRVAKAAVDGMALEDLVMIRELRLEPFDPDRLCPVGVDRG